MKVLVVDDSKVILKINSRTVTELISDADITSFQSPLEAIEKIKENGLKYDFALIDYNMEGLNGIELATSIVNEGFINKDRVAIVSANIQSAVKEKASEAGFHFVDKPLKPEDLKSFLTMRGIL